MDNNFMDLTEERIDITKIKENLSWLHSLLCDRKREVKTLEESILLLEKFLKKEERRK